jgi:hypothetical protein
MAGFDSMVGQSVRSLAHRPGAPISTDVYRGKFWDDAYAATVKAYDDFMIQPTEAVE